jgi:hypothetical protein
MASIHKPEKIKFLPREKWETLRGVKGKQGQRYAISNFGRVISYWNTLDYGYFLKPGLIAKKYPVISLRINGKGKTFFISKLVAKAYLKPPLAKQSFVINLDHNKENNHYKNLQWATREEMLKHMVQNPAWILHGRRGNQKLTEPKVRKIKERLAKGKSTLKSIAQQFGISDMQVYRIKTGENWAHVKI